MNHTSILQFRTANCKNCYKCIRNCPVKAIKVTNQQAQIIEEQCILCEKCIAVCPQHAKVEHNDIPELQKVIASGKKVIASVHPAYFARYGWKSIDDLEQCLKKMGFWKVVDAAEGAAMMKEKYTQFLKNQQQKTMRISSNRASDACLFYQTDARGLSQGAVSRCCSGIHQSVYLSDGRCRRRSGTDGLCDHIPGTE